MIQTKSQALKYLYGYIPKDEEYKFPGNSGLKRTKYLLKLLGEPQNKLKVIHIAGTSGKGSTAFFLSTILRSLGFTVGLNVSPHLLDLREQLQINNQLLGRQEFCNYLNEIIPAVEKTAVSKYGAPTYFEILVALAYYIFYKKAVDYAVIETGLGGTFDATNVISRPDKMAVVTKIGHDHTSILGKTLDKIASQKTGIIQLHNAVITIEQHPKNMKIIKKVSSEKKAKLYLITKNNIKNMTLIPTPKFSFKYSGMEIKDIQLLMLGSFQIQNCSLAIASAVLLSQRDKFGLNAEKIKSALNKAIFPGRMQKLLINNKTLIIDGAHNPQKMAVFAKNLAIYFPNQKFTFMIALKRGKDYKNILRYIVPLANNIIITAFFDQTKTQGMSVLAEDPATISKILDHLNFKSYRIYQSSKEALTTLLQDKKEVGVITGSLYLLSEIYPFLIKERGTWNKEA